MGEDFEHRMIQSRHLTSLANDRSRSRLVGDVVDLERGSIAILVDCALESLKVVFLQHVAIDTHLCGILVFGVCRVGHATTARAAMKVCSLLSILIELCLWSFDLDVLRSIIGPQRSIATTDGTTTLVELFSRRGEHKLDGLAVTCCCTQGAGRSGHDG